MGRLTQAIDYLNSEKHPTKDEVSSKYTHITITDHLKQVRKEYRKQNKLNDNREIT